MVNDDACRRTHPSGEHRSDRSKSEPAEYSRPARGVAPTLRAPVDPRLLASLTLPVALGTQTVAEVERPVGDTESTAVVSPDRSRPTSVKQAATALGVSKIPFSGCGSGTRSRCSKWHHGGAYWRPK